MGTAKDAKWAKVAWVESSFWEPRKALKVRKFAWGLIHGSPITAHGSLNIEESYALNDVAHMVGDLMGSVVEGGLELR